MHEYDGMLLQGRVKHCGWPDHHAPPLDHLLELLNEMTDWYRANEANVVVIHCIAGKGRTGTVCSSLLVKSQHMTALDALSAFGAARCVDGVGVVQPSQRRYVQYAEMRLKQPAAPKKILLLSVEISHAPNVDDEGCLARFYGEGNWLSREFTSPAQRAYK